MKAKYRMLWMKLHAYFACFFLPITLVYIITGMLYFFDIEGEVTAEIEYPVQLIHGWPTNEQQAKSIVLRSLAGKEHNQLPNDYYLYEGTHDWYGHEQEVILSPINDNKAKLVIKEHDLLLQLLIIHKGYAGNFFKVFSIMFGFSLAFSVISGVVITLQLPQLKKASLCFIIGGSIVLIAGFL
jgi:hypothetical protein